MRKKSLRKEYHHRHSKKCDLDGAPTIIFKSGRANFDRRQAQRNRVIKLGLKNYFFIIGKESSSERKYVTQNVEEIFGFLQTEKRKNFNNFQIPVATFLFFQIFFIS